MHMQSVSICWSTKLLFRAWKGFDCTRLMDSDFYVKYGREYYIRCCSKTPCCLQINLVSELKSIWPIYSRSRRQLSRENIDTPICLVAFRSSREETKWNLQLICFLITLSSNGAKYKCFLLETDCLLRTQINWSKSWAIVIPIVHQRSYRTKI